MIRLLRVLLVIALPLVALSAPIRGVAPSDQIQYTSENHISCFVNGKSTYLPLHQVNDEYCDCDDGSDEPGTAACSHVLHSVFYCENDGFVAEKIHTSRVHDGVCDCCDGSDEDMNGLVTCLNTCLVAAEEVSEAAKQRFEMVKIGFEKRQVIVEKEIAMYFEELEASKTTKEKELVAMKLVKDRVTVHKDREEVRENAYRLKVARQERVKTSDGDMNEDTTGTQECLNAAENEADESWKFEALDAIQIADGDALIDGAEDERVSEILDSNRQIVKSLVELPDGTRITLAEYLRMISKERARTKKLRTAATMQQDDVVDSLFHEKAGGRKTIGLVALRAIGIVISPIRVLVEGLLYSPRTLWSVLSTPELAGSVIDKLPNVPSPSRSVWFRRLGGGRVYDQYNLVMWSMQVIWDAPVYVYHYLFPTLDNELKLPVAESLRTVLREIDSDITILEKDQNEKLEAAQMDYGPDRAYFALKNKCIEKRIEKYVYKFCAFGEVKQDQTKLGKWDGWGKREENNDSSSSGKLDYTSMRYSKGQRCYNGPDRSVLVHLECGEHDEIMSVDEPSTCVYEMAVRSPLACTAQTLAKAQEDATFWTQKVIQ